MLNVFKIQIYHKTEFSQSTTVVKFAWNLKVGRVAENKPFLCHQCGRGFGRQEHVSRHAKICGQKKTRIKQALFKPNANPFDKVSSNFDFIINKTFNLFYTTCSYWLECVVWSELFFLQIQV